MEAVLNKVCFKCGELKEISCFYKHSKMKDGYLNKCKECAKKDARNNHSKNRDYYLKYDKERAMNPDRVEGRKRYARSERGKEVNKRLTRESREKFPKRYKARNTINNMLARGLIVKPSYCSCCGKDCNPHGHHDDYDKPTDVRWLCSTCHSDWHKENEPVNG